MIESSTPERDWFAIDPAALATPLRPASNKTIAFGPSNDEDYPGENWENYDEVERGILMRNWMRTIAEGIAGEREEIRSLVAAGG